MEEINQNKLARIMLFLKANSPVNELLQEIFYAALDYIQNRTDEKVEEKFSSFLDSQNPNVVFVVYSCLKIHQFLLLLQETRKKLEKFEEEATGNNSEIIQIFNKFDLDNWRNRDYGK